MAVIGAKGNFAGPGGAFEEEKKREIVCNEEHAVSAVLLTSLGVMGVGTNLALITIILVNKPLRRWSNGLIVHQACVDTVRAAILLPLGRSLFLCKNVEHCSFIETFFLLLVTVATINLLTSVLNDAPILPEDVGQDSLSILKDGPQCVAFGIFIIWFSSITLNLGPTFLSGAIASNEIEGQPSCPLVQGPYRHYVPNALWIIINIFCICLTLVHLHRLHTDFVRRQGKLLKSNTAIGKSPKRQCEISKINGSKNIYQEGMARVKMYLFITISYMMFWGPLFLETLVKWGWAWEDAKRSISHEVSLHIAFMHSFINPLLYIVLDRRTRVATFSCFCCLLSLEKDGGSLEEQTTHVSLVERQAIRTSEGERKRLPGEADYLADTEIALGKDSGAVSRLEPRTRTSI